MKTVKTEIFIIVCLFITLCIFTKNNTTYLEEASHKQRVFVLFSATWCGPCHKLQDDCRRLNLLKDYKVYNIDFDNDKELARRFNITLLPTYMIIENGKVIKRKSGYNGVADIIEFLR